MPNKTAIEWTDYSSNPIYAYDRQTNKRGWHCVHVSEGCRNCYAEAINKRFGTGLAYEAQNTSKVEFRLSPKELDGLRSLAKNHPGAKVFLGDMLDLFQPAISDALLNELFSGTLEILSMLTFQILTKHAQRMNDYLNWRWGDGRIPCRHIWIGVSVENQAMADKRIPLLLDTPARTRFVSYEPALEALDLLNADGDGVRGGLRGGLHWMIIGGESGSSARPFNVDWARKAISDCRLGGIAPFVKQIGSRPVATDGAGKSIGTWPLAIKHSKGGDISEWPEDLRVREYPNTQQPATVSAHLAQQVGVASSVPHEPRS